MTSYLQGIKFSNPGTYYVKILGNASPELWDNFEGEVEKVTRYKDGHVTSTLKFHVRDQVELSGIIDVLFRHRQVLLSIYRNDQNEEQSKEQAIN